MTTKLGLIYFEIALQFGRRRPLYSVRSTSIWVCNSAMKIWPDEISWKKCTWNFVMPVYFPADFTLLWMFWIVVDVGKCSECCEILWMLQNVRKLWQKCCKMLWMMQNIADVAKSCECCEILWMLWNATNVVKCYKLDMNVVKCCECCKMSGNCDKKSKSRKKLEWSIHDEMQRNLKFSSLTKVIPWTARLSSWSKTRNPSILDILQWDDWTMIWSSRRLMVQCLFW